MEVAARPAASLKPAGYEPVFFFVIFGGENC
jgi:hypothetical protein